MKRSEKRQLDPHFDSNKSAILEIWDELQRLQTDFCLPQELSQYYCSSAWQSANSVIDLGTGNGYYLGKLAGLFCEKTYFGIDSSAELVQIAKNEVQRPNVQFADIDLYEVTGAYDFAIMRLLMQHLDDIPAALRHVASIVGRGGSALVIDACDPMRVYVPELPEFTDFFNAYTANELKNGRDRRFAETFCLSIDSSTEWEVVESAKLLIPSSVGENKILFGKTYQRLIDLVEVVGELKYDFQLVRKSLRNWIEKRESYMQVGLSMIELRRT